MSRKKLKTIVAASYNNDIMDFNKVHTIVTSLRSRNGLKQYINELKNYENKKNVTVTTPFNVNKAKVFEKLFPNKKIVYKIDPSLMLGVKIVNNDNVYEFNLKNILQNITPYITKSYDW